MKRNVRVFGLPVLVASGVIAAVASCGGGERPVPESNVAPDSGTASSSSSGSVPGTELITGLEEGADGTGLYFGDNGLVNCGKQAPEKTLILNNPTDNVINFEAKVTVGDAYYTINPAKGGIPIKGTAAIKIVPAPIPQASEITPDLYAGTLEVTTSPSQPPTTIRLHQTARGVVIKSQPDPEIDFGSVRVGSPQPHTFNLTNSGNVPVTVNLGVATNAFRIDGAATSSVTLDPGAAGSKEIVFGPTEAKQYLDTLTVTFDPNTAHCAPPPSTFELKGEGTTSVGVSPGTLQFGLVDCGSTAPFQPVTISSTSAMTFTPSLGKSGASAYTLADSSGSPVAVGSTISMSAASTYVLRVVPKPITLPANMAANAYDDTLTITTDVPTDSPHNVQLRQVAQGAVFVLEPQSIAVTGTISETKTTNFTLRNTGNAPAPYQLTATPAGTFTSSLTSGTAQVGNTPGTLTTKLPSTFGTSVQGSLQVTSTGGVLCADLPPEMPLTATTGEGTSVTVTPTSLNFGLVDCGTAAPFQTVEITTLVATTFRPNLGLGGGSSFSLADSNGTAVTLGGDIPISPGTPYTLRVVPKTVPIPSSTNANALGDTLSITSPADGPTPKNIALSQTARGAIFALTPAAIDFAATSTKDFQLVNSGNASASYTITVTGPFTSNRTTGSAPVGSLTGTLTKNSAGTGTLSVTSDGVLCADPPAPVPITAN